jgi:hypothetical protein
MLERIVVVALLAVASFPALADECVFVSQNVAEKAAALIPKGTVIQLFCANCGDKQAKRSVVNTVTVAPEPPDWKVMVNDENLDLAYVYILPGSGKKEWTNLGLLAACPDDDQSRILPPKALVNP